jgi:VanZ family protein
MPVIAWMLLIFIGSSDVLSAEHTSRFIVPFLRWLDPHISYATIAAVHLVVRKLGHFTEYAILAALLWRALRGTFVVSSLAIVAAGTFLITAGFAASDEFHQSFVMSRTASAHDVLIDCVGVTCAILVCAAFAARRERLLARQS